MRRHFSWHAAHSKHTPRHGELNYVEVRWFLGHAVHCHSMIVLEFKRTFCHVRVWTHEFLCMKKSACFCVSEARRNTFYDKIFKFSGPFINNQACWKYTWTFLTVTPIAALRQPLTSLAAFIVLCQCPDKWLALPSVPTHRRQIAGQVDWRGCVAHGGGLFEVRCI